jgi:hypothetical protein
MVLGQQRGVGLIEVGTIEAYKPNENRYLWESCLTACIFRNAPMILQVLCVNNVPLQLCLNNCLPDIIPTGEE